MSKTFKDAPDRKFNRREAIKTIHDFAAKNSADPELFERWLHEREDDELREFQTKINDEVPA
jgi:hypothetical protein